MWPKLLKNRKRQELTQTILVDLDRKILEELLHQMCMDVRIRHLRTASLTLSTGLKAVVGLKRWFEKMEQVFEICKCAEDDKIPWSNVKAMMTTEYCLATEIQKMEQELWTLTLKGDDIEAHNSRFHELVLMCPELVSTENKKIEKYIRGFPEGIKGNVTSSKPATLHD
ncbi:putative reverse transcriptase domain-containing protein, partial [Tanacetum coccineum]